jgi:hypothetical protein
METYTYYPELVSQSTWGKDEVLLQGDINLLKHTPFNETGYGIVPIHYDMSCITSHVKKRIHDIISYDIPLDQYHLHVNPEQHRQVINTMPYKRNDTPELSEFCKYVEDLVSTQLKEKVKIFNDDIWVRICRPNTVSHDDFNPCHRDVYLDFYRNTANIYLPLTGSNEKSSLFLQEKSHLWNENKTAVTTGGAHFKSKNKKYSVDAIVQSTIKLNMIRPNPSLQEMMIFSPYLIHGCSDNDNIDVTRMSLEIRFIQVDRTHQETEFNEFITSRIWR